MKRITPVLAAAVLAALTIGAASASAALPGMISVTAPAVVKLDTSGTPESSAVLHNVYRSGYDGGALNIRVREGTSVVRDAFIPAYNQPCEPPPSYRCVTRARIRDLRRVDGRVLRRNRLYVVEAWFESWAGSSAPVNLLDPGVRYAAFWTV